MKEERRVSSLEERFLQSGLVTEKQLERAKAQALGGAKTLWSVLVRSGSLSEEDILVFFAQESGIAHVRICDYEISLEVLRLLSEDFCRQHAVIPLFRVREILFIACVNPLDSMLIENMAKVTGCTIEPLLASATAIAQALDLYHGPQEHAFAMAGLLMSQGNVQGLAYRRESERVELRVPVTITIEDASVKLSRDQALSAMTRNISANGAALNLQAFLFLPKGIRISLAFNLEKPLEDRRQAIKAPGEIVYSQMEKNRRYLLGVKFNDLPQENIERLLSLACKNKEDSS